MRFRSFLAVLVLAIAGLGLTGCGSSGNNSEFVATNGGGFTPTTGAVVFNFVTAQAPFTVDANTASLQFDFYNGVDPTPIFSTTRDFDTTVSIGGVPTAARSVIITGFDSNGFPLYTINQTVTVVGGETTTVDGVNAAVPVSLLQLSLSGDPFVPSELTQVNVPLNGTAQVFLFAEYSNGSRVLVGDLATYQVENASIATVNTLGTVSGLAIGNTNLLAQFSGQTLPVPVIVTDGLAVTITSITISPASPVSVSDGNPVQLSVSGTTGTQSFGLTNDVTFLSDNIQFNVNSSGELSTSAASGSSAMITATYTNPDSSTVTDTITATVP